MSRGKGMHNVCTCYARLDKADAEVDRLLGLIRNIECCSEWCGLDTDALCSNCHLRKQAEPEKTNG